MAKKMLIDATQGEETRVTVIDGNRLDELDFEIASRKQLKGNIYLAKVTRVEPSLQAAFVEYGGNRHGFLAFAEIHPDYYKIPVADREKLLELEREEAEREAAEEEAALAAAELRQQAPQQPVDLLDIPAYGEPSELAPSSEVPLVISEPEIVSTPLNDMPEAELPLAQAAPVEVVEPVSQIDATVSVSPEVMTEAVPAPIGESLIEATEAIAEAGEGEGEPEGEAPADSDEDADRRKRSRRRAAILRQYKIQEVIKRNQIMLIQVVKEERGNKGAALTTYLSLAGRYCVLMPNTNRGGGVSRKISSLEERRRMKQLLAELDMPQGMSIILRTAGLERSKSDIKRDLEYLMRLWDSIREKTLTSTAPSLIHEEANLIRRAIRDLYSRDVAEIHVEGDAGYRTAKDFMRMLVPSASRRVHHYRDPAVPLFVRYRVESQIESLYSTTVNLRSGGYLVINQTEALVAIDVNSGRSTRERNIEETALRTNLEAADEVARQVRLRDLAGLVVIDFIDMEDQRHNAQVERRMREAMKSDRARIQIGRISMFGLMELSRQRLRPSLIETNFSPCAVCGGIGHVRSVESAALHVLRSVEEEGLQQKASELAVTVSEPVALYLLNHKRAALSDVERRYGLKVFIHSSAEIVKNAEHKIERLKARLPGEFAFPEPPPPVIEDEPPLPEGHEDEDLIEDNDSSEAEGSAGEDGEQGSSSSEENGGRGDRNRRRSRGGRGRDRSNGRGPRGDRPAYPNVAEPGAPQPEIPLFDAEGNPIQPTGLPAPEGEQNYVPLTAHSAEGQPNVEGQPQGQQGQGQDGEARRRRRGRRGGRGRFRGERGDRPAELNANGEPMVSDANGNVADAPQGGEGGEMQPQAPRDPNAPREYRGERQDRGPRPPRPPREDRGPRGDDRGPRRPRGDRPQHHGGEGRYDRGPRPDAQVASGEGSGIKIISEFKGREPAQPQYTAPAAPQPSAPVAAPAAAPASDKPKSGWWKRLMGSNS